MNSTQIRHFEDAADNINMRKWDEIYVRGLWDRPIKFGNLTFPGSDFIQQLHELEMTYNELILKHI